ncbi:MAG TPA: hypothetical protein VHU81_12965 [Thermoanaerobaculia bacterium]|nr:hypothetical protein [Thermoanaerobaculia bacterium]
MKKAGMAFLVLALCGCGADRQAASPPRPEAPARRDVTPAAPAPAPVVAASPEPAADLAIDPEAGVPTNGPVVTAPGPVASLPPVEHWTLPCPETPRVLPEATFAALGDEAQAPLEGAVAASIQLTPRTDRSLAMPTLAEWHEGYREASLPARAALSRVVEPLNTGQLPSYSDCVALADSARQVRPALHAPDTRISGSLDEAYETLVDLGDACAQGHQIGSMGLLKLAERRLDKAAVALRRYGLEP